MNRVWYALSSNKTFPADTIHQILMFGRLSDIQSLKKAVGVTTVKEMFLRFPKKVYTKAALNFTKKFILKLTSSIDERQYLKNTPRVTR